MKNSKIVLPLSMIAVFAVLTVFAVSTASAANTVYFDSQHSTITGGPCNTTTVELRVTTTDAINSWNTYIEFNSSCVNITGCSFDGSPISHISGWAHHGSWIDIGATKNDPNDSCISGDQLLATLTIHCEEGNCTSPLNFTGTENVWRYIGCAKVPALYSATWQNGTVTNAAPTPTPNITSFAPTSPVKNTVCNWRTFNVTVNQTVNVSWYLNDSLLHTNVSTKEANYTLHAEVAGEHNVSAVAMNANGSDMQTWIWNVTTVLVAGAPNITSFAPTSPVNNTVCNWRTFNVTVNQTVNVSWYLNDSLLHTNVSTKEANYTLHAEVAGEHNVSAVATNANGSDMQTWWWTVEDVTAPASVTSLQNATYQQTYINWTWTDPVDEDFAKVMVYLNGTFTENVTKGIQLYNATELTNDTAYEIGTRTVDTSGNINQTWVNHTASTKPPIQLMEGDANLDNCVSLKDSTLIKLYKAGLKDLTSDQRKCADTWDDDDVTLKDSTFIKKWLVDDTTPLWESPADDDMLEPVPC